jgi:hypothetical protein
MGVFAEIVLQIVLDNNFRAKSLLAFGFLEFTYKLL